ncbi:uncharacterized protein [Antedon mediterranea]|uniref:uncharacterized protein n=1 Tax=Antedon mediterranea TaxID=105859 RepID=UPI003AF8A93C
MVEQVYSMRVDENQTWRRLDGNTNIKCKLWNEFASKVGEQNVGWKITLNNVEVDNYNNVKCLQSTDLTTVEISEDDVIVEPAQEVQVTIVGVDENECCAELVTFQSIKID